MTRSLVLSCVLAALAAGHAQAQSAPPVMAPKRAAQRAAAATNSHTIAMTADQSASGSAKAASATVREAVISRGATSDSVSGAARKAADAKPGFRRETFSYDRSGRRDPFVSLMTSGELRPLITDLRLVAIAYAPSGRGSVAVLRDLVTKDQYRVKVGQTLGRMHVSRIGSKKVLFTIEEFGFSRQQELTLGDSTQARTK